jgi:hypothetical protein
MFENKKNLLFAIFAVILFIIIFIYTKQTSHNDMRNSQTNNPDLQNLSESDTSKLFPMGVPGEFGDGSSVLDSEVLLNYSVFSDMLRTGEINFVWEVWKLRRLCPEDYKPDQCNEIILSHIDKSYSPPDNELLKKLFKDYFRYEVALREFEISDSLKFEDKYELLKKKRREVFKEENSKLVFGMEEATVEFLNLQKDFLESTKKLSGDEKVKSYEELKKKTLGSYYENITKREDPYNNYQTELSLRESELSKLSVEDKNSILQKTQLKYFGKEGVEKLLKVQEEIAKEEKKIQDYEKKAEEFLSQNVSLSAKEKEEKLNDLRIKMLGEEDAGAYSRRKEFEELTKSIK